MNLILLTASYPYIQGTEASFLNIEVEYLAKTFDRVVLVPETRKERTALNHPGIEVDTSYADVYASKGILDLIWLSFSSRILSLGVMESDFPRFSPTAWRRLIAFTGKAELIRRWAVGWLQQQDLDPKDCLFYTYWLDHAAAGLGLVKQQFAGLALVSRAHGYDIYEEQYYDPPFWPCRRTVLKNIDMVYAASTAGTTYLKERYAEFSNKFDTSLLGVRDPGFISEQSTDKVFRIVSCSRISPEKRLELLLEGIAAAARRRPEQRFEWHHIGNGDQKDALQEQMDASFPPNVKGFLHRYSDGHTLMDFYRNHPIDIFANSSSTEGTSVSIMEAISCGIPVLATRVGGNVEIVSEQNGVLVPAESSPDDIAGALLEFMDDVASPSKRTGSRHKWSAEYNADVNFPEFTRELKALRMATSD